MFKRTAYELKNGSRRTVLPTAELAANLKSADPIAWRYARVTPVQVSWLRPGFGVVENFPAKVSRTTVVQSTDPSAPVAAPKKRGRPTNAERALRGIAPANATEASVPSVPTAPTVA